MVTGPQISLKNISLSFGKEPVFEKLNLLIHPRDRIALVGRNGSGKSTLLKVLQGLVVLRLKELKRKSISIVLHCCAIDIWHLTTGVQK